VESKAEIRRRFLEMRDALSDEEILGRSRMVGKEFLRFVDHHETGRIALYASLRREVQTRELFEELKKRGKTIFFPRVAGKNLEWVQTDDLSGLSPGRWGIEEPRPGTSVPLRKGDLVVIPGVAFDEAGGRLGFGHGFYDRSLKDLDVTKIGLAFDFQIVAQLPREAGDLRCHFIITEKRIIEGGSLWNLSSF